METVFENRTEALRSLLVSGVASMLALGAVACRGTPSRIDADIPPAVAPLLGFDRLGFSGDRVLATVLLGQWANVVIDSRHASAQLNDHDTITVDFDGIDTGDVVLSLDACPGLREALVSHWGEGTQSQSATTWTPPHGTWVARYTEEARCVLTLVNTRRFATGIGAPRPIGYLLPEMTRQRARELAPGVADASTAVPLAGAPDCRVGVTYDARTDRVKGTMVIVPPWLEGVVMGSWGPGTVVAGKLRIWNDEVRHVRAITSSDDEQESTRRIDFDTYVPWRRWLQGGNRLGLPSTSIIGATAEEVRIAYGDAFRNDDHGDLRPTDPVEFWIEAMPTELTPPGGSRIDLRFDDAARVRSYSFSLWYPDLPTRTSMMAAFEDRWGPRTKTTTGWEMHADGLRISIDEFREGVISVAVQRP